MSEQRPIWICKAVAARESQIEEELNVLAGMGYQIFNISYRFPLETEFPGLCLITAFDPVQLMQRMQQAGNASMQDMLKELIDRTNAR